MADKIASPKGTEDLLPQDSYRWQYVERKALEIAGLFGFKEVRVPTFEHTELFNRGVGDTTDVVQKEMYTFDDKAGRSITLRPELTAGVCRSVIQNGLLSTGVLPIRACYVASCFRYENTQATRLREFHQFGVECFGPKGPSADAQVIGVAYNVFKSLGLKNIKLLINSIGCPTCRKKYQQALIEYFNGFKGDLCETCLTRLEKNPMRIIDCKDKDCKEIAKNAPNILDYICEECQEHFDGLKHNLDLMDISYEIDPTIVRGLDYYTKTVIEFVSTYRGENVTICGGGRYDGLIEQLGGQPTPALGFAVGIERLLKVMEEQDAPFQPDNKCFVYIGNRGQAAADRSQQLVDALRKDGFWAENDVMDRSVKAQMKYADKIGARYTIILGDDELANGKGVVKNMASGEQTEVPLQTEEFVEAMYGLIYSEMTFDE
ncbi:MAG: histidine--tRNA ligase [Oscillospiraceae bacterium]|nr:histidine--tRNA ligase [Oscillospiraceae bacterium]